ncbi:MAG: V-type ATP synthase subunit F [Candidatus Hodarchaeales archaeon]|jgi:vacuolar-type H+-ATPase subunit F/Vma7
MTAIGDPETCTWLKLAGIGEVHPIEGDHQDPYEILSSLWSRKDISIILVTPNIAERYHQQITEFMVKNPFPIIMELPISREDVKDPLTELIRQAVGINLEL